MDGLESNLESDTMKLHNSFDRGQSEEHKTVTDYALVAGLAIWTNINIIHRN